MYKQIIRIINSENTEGFYIDYTGGLRDTTYFLAQLTQYLQFDGLLCHKIVYSEYYSKTIYELNNIYNLGKMFQAANLFIETGNPAQFILFLKENSAYITKEIGSESYESLLKYIYDIKDFTDTITLCNIGRMDTVRKNVVEATKKLKLENSRNLYISMFKSLNEKIKKSFYLNKEVLEYPDIIRWCVNHRLIQQAITIYQSKMPEFYLQKSFFKKLLPDYKTKKRNYTPGSSSLEETAFYTDLYDLFKTTKIEYNSTAGENDSNTYLIKVSACYYLITKNSFSIKDNNKLADIMRYYLAVKIIRNKINHANDSEKTDAEKLTARFLNCKKLFSENDEEIFKNFKPISLSLTVDNISEILLDGISLTVPKN